MDALAAEKAGIERAGYFCVFRPLDDGAAVAEQRGLIFKKAGFFGKKTPTSGATVLCLHHGRHSLVHMPISGLGEDSSVLVLDTENFTGLDFVPNVNLQFFSAALIGLFADNP